MEDNYSKGIEEIGKDYDDFMANVEVGESTDSSSSGTKERPTSSLEFFNMLQNDDVATPSTRLVDNEQISNTYDLEKPQEKDNPTEEAYGENYQEKKLSDNNTLQPQIDPSHPYGKETLLLGQEQRPVVSLE